MGNRLSKIYTRTGDDGTTGLGDGSRVDKDDLRVEAMGDIDELNSIIGMLLLNELPDVARECLINVQHNLFDIGGEIAMPGYIAIDEGHVSMLEDTLDQLNDKLEPLKEFILPGGSQAGAVAHLARSVCRRAERRLYSLSKEHDVNVNGRQFVNRLSDLLFVMARSFNHHAGDQDVLWNHDRSKSSS